MSQLSRHDDRPQPFLRQLNRLCGEINAVLVAIAIGLAVLDLTCAATLETTAAIARAQLNPPPPSEAALSTSAPAPEQPGAPGRI